MQEYGGASQNKSSASELAALQRKTQKVAQLAQKLFNLTMLEERLIARKKILEAQGAAEQMRRSENNLVV